ncbi:hypothetical protein BASA50_000862 [Batrachochytrium salamandrivorans]|uniref:Extracellular membrane protein CFEM domain-containing protein n=1 Tax=Batrachochytrium salamandrivorans TaxID=1357716 RepID=A0ABQ8ESI4_9FUNG|nr:hypothetical protein BASA62_006124 [Batrachochytrium salamandrivorans]KAH6575921.1 hypothetical protein BASA60_004738 [Batrachochytrium salamandrivorans]KAH6585918.1 hypothetical protein BASA50_000862 [Batrachochytrium salamandrivorans]KAH6591726.1 hypothetical protein BASA61_004807 [Batrachochytrium salamandrivorans]KAH9275801.1 hypothetical protein BASA83_001603 [Batrachochytrium salamandrivorans]
MWSLSKVSLFSFMVLSSVLADTVDPTACPNCLALCHANWVQTGINCAANDTPQCRSFQCSYDQICKSQCSTHFQCVSSINPMCASPPTPVPTDTTCSGVVTVTTTRTHTYTESVCPTTTTTTQIATMTTTNPRQTTMAGLEFEMMFDVPTDGLLGYPYSR